MRYRGNPACVEARESISDSPLERERIASHRTRCADCREHAEREQEVKRSLLLITERGLDDVARARIQARLAGTFDRMAAENARGKPSNRIWIAAAIAAALLLVWIWPKQELEVQPTRERLVPFLVAGTSEARLTATDAIEAGAGMIVRAELEGQGEVTLIGPGRARVEAADAVSLESGLLLLHVGHPFEVHAGEVTVRVLGTRFAVDRRETLRVSVSEGVVEVARDGAVDRLVRGESWPRGTPVEERLSVEQLAPPRGPSGVVVIGGTPAGAVAKLDGVILGPTPLIARLAAGAHQLEVQADLHATHEQRIDVPDGAVIHVSYALDHAAEEPKHVAPRPKPRKKVEPAPAPETAETIYRRAEEALASDRTGDARQLLEDLGARFPGDPLVESALYELARLDYQDGALEDAHARLIDLLERRQDAELAESGQRLLCQIDVETSRYDDANACWRSFRQRFPASVHDAEALASLIGLAQIWNDCPRVKSLAEEFRSRYPDHALRPDVEARVKRCSE